MIARPRRRCETPSPPFAATGDGRPSPHSHTCTCVADSPISAQTQKPYHVSSCNCVTYVTASHNKHYVKQRNMLAERVLRSHGEQVVQVRRRAGRIDSKKSRSSGKSVLWMIA